MAPHCSSVQSTPLSPSTVPVGGKQLPRYTHLSQFNYDAHPQIDKLASRGTILINPALKSLPLHGQRPQVGGGVMAEAEKVCSCGGKNEPGEEVNQYDVILTKEQRTWTKEGWRKQPRAQMFIAIFFFHCCASFMTFVMNFVHLRMPDPRKNEPLSDIMHDLIPMQHFGHLAEFCIWVSILSGWFASIYVLGPYMARPSIRFALAWGSTWLLRSFVMLSTTLPPTDDHYCRHDYPDYPNDFPHPIGSVMHNTLIGVATFGYGNVHCGDLMFSGHTTSLVLSVLYCYTYVRPYVPKWVFPLSVICGFGKAFCMVAQRDHYTADVLVSAFASISFWHFAPERFPYLPGRTFPFIKKALSRIMFSTCEATDSASREAANEARQRSSDKSGQITRQSSNRTAQPYLQTGDLQSFRRSNSSSCSPVNGGHSPDPDRNNSTTSIDDDMGNTTRLRTRARPPTRVGSFSGSRSSPSPTPCSGGSNSAFTAYSRASVRSSDSENNQIGEWDGRAKNETNNTKNNITNVQGTQSAAALPATTLGVFPNGCETCGGGGAPMVYFALAPTACVHQISAASTMSRGMRGYTRRGCYPGSPAGPGAGVAQWLKPQSPISTSSGAVRRQ